MSFFTSALRSAGILSHENPQQFGEELRRKVGPLAVPVARVLEKISNLTQGTVDPLKLPVSRPRYQFTILLERIRKTVERVTLLQILSNPPLIDGKPLTFEQLVGEDPERRALLEKICPGIFKATPLKQKDLIRVALEYQENRLKRLLDQVIRWTFLQPDWQSLSQETVFDMLEEVKGALTSKIKWISDPYIPFLKMAIEERAIWHLRSIKDPGASAHYQLFDALQREQEMIFGKVLEMYYNTFLGADHPKVQENLRNQNDLCQIEPQDVKDRIIELQLKAVAGHLAPDMESKEAVYQLLLKLYKDPRAFVMLDKAESALYDKILAKWQQLTRSDLKAIPLEYFVTHAPVNSAADPEIQRDLAQYHAMSKTLSLTKQTFPQQEACCLKASHIKLEEHKAEIIRLEQTLKHLTAQKKQLEDKLSSYPAGLGEKAASLQVEIWKLEDEIAKANRVMKFFLEGSHRRTAASFAETIALRAKESVDEAKLQRCIEERKMIIIQIAGHRSEVLQTEEEIAVGRAQFREIAKVSTRKLKIELDDLASKVYYLTPEQLDALMKHDDTEWVM